MYNLCKFKCGSHKLPIEMGDSIALIKMLNRCDIICDFSDLNEFGDKFHNLNSTVWILKILIFTNDLLNVGNTYCLNEQL